MATSPRGGRATAPTSRRAWGCLGGLLTGYLVMAVLAGVPGSPLTVLLPDGARPPGWAAAVARATRLDALDRPAQIAAAVVLAATLVATFAGVAAEAWSGHLSIRVAAGAAGVALVLAVAAPLLLSRDVYSYADAGHLAATRHDPYVTPIGSLHDDPFVRATSVQWLRHPTLYGPAFTLVSEAIVRLAPRSPTTVILAYKVLAGTSVAVTVWCAWLLARALRPSRAVFATVVVGLDPVVVFHTVGGGHVDALVGALLAGAAVLALVDRPPHPRHAAGATALLTLAVLVKVVFLPVLVLWLVHHLRTVDRGRRAPVAALHAAAAVGPAAVVVAPFANGWATVRPLASVGGLEWWASPVHLVAHTAARAVGPSAGGLANLLVVTGFLLLAAVVGVRMARRSTDPAPTAAATLLLLALSLPFLLPWYACWFLPFLAMLDDDRLVAVGVGASLLLALTLVPADPFHGLTTPGVMAFVHYVVGPAMLALLAIIVRRLWRSSPKPPSRRPTPTTRPVTVEII